MVSITIGPSYYGGHGIMLNRTGGFPIRRFFSARKEAVKTNGETRVETGQRKNLCVCFSCAAVVSAKKNQGSPKNLTWRKILTDKKWTRQFLIWFICVRNVIWPRTNMETPSSVNDFPVMTSLDSNCSSMYQGEYSLHLFCEGIHTSLRNWKKWVLLIAHLISQTDIS